jgi:hypothetical protein
MQQAISLNDTDIYGKTRQAIASNIKTACLFNH